MIIHIMDETQTPLDVIDAYYSYIWTEAYGKCGTFELYLPLKYIKNDILAKGMYLYSEGMRNTNLMVIEDIQINAKTDGDQMVLTGRSLESIIDRRIVWDAPDDANPKIKETAYKTIKNLLLTNVIYPNDDKRQIPGFIFEESTDEAVLNATMPYLEEDEVFGANLYDVISTICQGANLGFRIKPDFKGGFIFALYSGKDRTASQTTNQPVIFSTKLETLLGSNYFKSSKDVKNSVLVWGPTQDFYETDEDGNEVYTGSVQHRYEGGTATGLNRKEGFIEASEVEMTEDEEASEDYDTIKYTKQQAYMAYKSEEFLDEYKKPIITFDGELNTRTQYIYKKDYDIGDIVEVVNDYDIRCVCRITEVVYSYGEEGGTILPTFTNISEEITDETDI